MGVIKKGVFGEVRRSLTRWSSDCMAPCHGEVTQNVEKAPFPSNICVILVIVYTLHTFCTSSSLLEDTSLRALKSSFLRVEALRALVSFQRRGHFFQRF